MKNKYEYKGWELTVNRITSTVEVIKDDETRIYDLLGPIIKSEQEEMYVDVYVENGTYYSFKMEEKENSLIGDIYDGNEEHVESFALHCFAEESFE